MSGKEVLDRLVADITSGVYSKEGKLPGETALAASFGVSRMTLRTALDELRRQGLIEKRNGAGSFLTKRALRKSGLIGLVIPDYESFGFFAAIKGEVSRHAARLRYRVELVSSSARTHDEMVLDIRHKVRALAVNKAEGVIFRPFVPETFSETNMEIVKILRRAEIPVVLIDSDVTRPPMRSDCDLVAVNNIGAGRQIADHLHDRGYGRIAFLMQGPSHLANANWSNRLFGLAGELALLGHEGSVCRLTLAPSNERMLRDVMRKRDRPDAIVCGNDEQASVLIQTLAKIGKRVPNDVAVVGFDDVPIARTSVPPLTTISQPVKKLAATAFKTLLARMRYPNNDPREILLDAPLVVRRSTSKAGG